MHEPLGGHEPLDRVLAVRGDRRDAEALEGREIRIPGRIDERPRQPGLEDRAADDGEVIVERRVRDDLRDAFGRRRTLWNANRRRSGRALWLGDR
jgi:hypothetical protein